MSRVYVTEFGFVHYHAFCSVCNFTSAILSQEADKAEDVRRAVREHVRETGHEVTIEAGKVTRYALEFTA